MVDEPPATTDPATPDTAGYLQQGNTSFESVMAARTASREAAFVLPNLRPGMRLLDVGCGPGSITLGLAEYVKPGEVVGTDFQPTQIESARQLASTHGAENVRFEIADAYELPFPNEFFDAAFANGVVMHLAEPVKALMEIRRVLSTDGFVAIRDPGMTVRAPEVSALETWRNLAARARERATGDTFVGPHHRRLLLEAGFARTKATASVQTAGTEAETIGQAAFLKAQLQSFARVALSEGWADQPAVDGLMEEIDAWALRPDAFAATVWCEAIGWVSA